jgi:peroxiredoxin Q/BCP
MPDFHLKDQNGKVHNLKDYQGKYLLIWFYPKDFTPGCTSEAKCFRNLTSEFASFNCALLGVSADSEASHLKFSQKYKLPFPLLADPSKDLISALGLWVKKTFLGKSYMGTQRDSFLIGPDSRILKHYVKVNPLLHPKQVLEDLRSLTPRLNK